ncbi:hypothetical protein DH2020_019888 [Rehmannia glutinosa]|uniref:Retrotransposon Copia-like N-terminal domain-containing protein n=1 Tax=Rehmannia glutinosa TaxID=99300 RepID=A0ABR0WG09_REHGL
MEDPKTPPTGPQVINPQTVQPSITQPQNQVVTVKLTDNNYLLWKMQILTAVRGCGLLGFLTGKLQPPDKFLVNTETQEAKPNPEYETYLRQDQLLASWVLSTLSESVLVLAIGLDSASEIWNSLETNFSSQSKARLILSDEDQVLHVLSGLPSEYNPVIVTITSAIDFFSMSEASALLLSFESRLDLVSDTNTNTTGESFTANFAQSEQRKNTGYITANRGRGAPFQRGRGRSNYRGRGGRSHSSNRPICQVCHVPEHTADRCYYRQHFQLVSLIAHTIAGRNNKEINITASRREFVNANGTKTELAVFNPSDYYQYKGSPQFRTINHKKIEDLRAGFRIGNRCMHDRAMNSSPVFQCQSERSAFMSRCASTRDH